tara:strand:- start:1305 stop:1568 length:264 start_codon:yes stop_codon:yes gene_type:complete
VKISKAQIRKIIKEEVQKELSEIEIGGLMAMIKMRVGDAQRSIAKNPEQPAELMTPLLDKLSEEVATLQDEVTKKLSRLMTLSSNRG